MTPDDVDRRLNELEIKASLADDAIERLSDVVAGQQARIDALVRELARLAGRIDGLDPSEGAAGARDEVPPHW